GLTTAITAVIDSEGELSADYVFAPTEGGVAEFTAYYTADGTDVTSYTFSSIPYKRNYQTNISGNLLTKQGDITVTVNPVWEGEEDVYLSGTVSVATVEEANEFFESYAGTEDVNITIGVVDGAEAIEIPSTITSNVTFVIESAINEPVLVVTTEISGDVTIDNQSGTAMGLDVTAENASVYVKGSYNSISVASAPSTAYITEGAEVTETLTVNKGNVVLYGTVGSIVRGSENSDEVTTLYTYSCATVTSVEANDAITQEYLPYFAPGVTEIATSEFENNKVFTMVIIPEGIETIGTKAFYSTSIKAVYIPSTVEYVGEYSFSRCGSLEKIEVHAKEIGTGAFEQTNGTEIDDIIATSEIIGSSAFNGIHFEELVISGSVKEIYSAAFGYNSMLKKITIPATVEKLANSAFQHADNLEEVILEGSVPAEIIPSDCGTYANPFSSRYVVPINFYVPEGSESAYLEAWPKVWSYHYAYFLNGVAITAESFIDMEIAEIVNNSESGQVTISSVGTSTFALTIPESTTSEGQVIEIFIDSVTCDTELYINAADYNGKVKINLNDNGGFSVDLWLGSSSTSGDVIMGSGSWRNVYYGGTPSWYTNE
ncbi:MAG: leucine-rich repeat domain-containing protein, partial [Rikenellaceae bacterium]